MMRLGLMRKKRAKEMQSDIHDICGLDLEIVKEQVPAQTIFIWNHRQKMSMMSEKKVI